MDAETRFRCLWSIRRAKIISDEKGCIELIVMPGRRKSVRIGILAVVAWLGVPAQAPDSAAIIKSVDAAVAARYEHVLGFTDTEHYAVYRGKDEASPAAELTVKDTYLKGVGKSYTVLSQSGSPILQKLGLEPLLDHEKEINLPGNVEKSWFTSANYEMKLRPGGSIGLNNRKCFVIDIRAKRKAPNTIDGSMWVDAVDESLVQIEGTATQNASIFSGPTHMMRQYTNIDGYSMAQHARAESESTLFGRTVVTVDYSDYKLELEPTR